jgi:hypothetical protein
VGKTTYILFLCICPQLLAQCPIIHSMGVKRKEREERGVKKKEVREE